MQFNRGKKITFPSLKVSGRDHIQTSFGPRHFTTEGCQVKKFRLLFPTEIVGGAILRCNVGYAQTHHTTRRGV